jgi:glycosyltransferase involved in cell wall biosynthesis
VITLLTPYDRTETTEAAIRLAEMVVCSGRSVRVVACGKRNRFVDPVWDRRVKSDEGDGLYHAVKGAAAVVHFGYRVQWLKAAELVSSPAKQILVAPWHTTTTSDLTQFKKYANIVCPSAGEHNQLALMLGGLGHDRSRFCHVPWVGSLPAVAREGTVATGRTNVCFYGDATTADFDAQILWPLVEELIQAVPALDITVAAAVSRSRQHRRVASRVLARWPNRVRRIRVEYPIGLAELFHANDWTVYPAVRGSFGCVVHRALACGTPVVCHNIPPFAEIVGAKKGVLVPCASGRGGTLAPIAATNLAEWATTCIRAFSDRRCVLRLQTHDWKISERVAKFNAAWDALLPG